MSLDRSLKGANALVRHRNVLTRTERLVKLTEEERWTDAKSVFGLPKVAHRKQELAKVEKEPAADAAGAALGTAAPAGAAAPAAGAKGAAPVGAKGAAGAKAGAPAAKAGAPAAKAAAPAGKKK